MATMEKKRITYMVYSFTTSNENDDQQWFTLEIRLHRNRFRLYVSPSNFHNSPAQSEVFQKYHKFLVLEQNSSDGSIKKAPPLYKCSNWAVTPCLEAFDRLSPGREPLKEGEQLNLSHFLAVDTLECELTAVDDVLIPGEIKLPDDPTDEDAWPFPDPPPCPARSGRKPSLPSFQPEEVAVICEDRAHPFDSNKNQVYIGKQDLYFKEGFDLDDHITKREIGVYEQIARANFGPSVRTSRLYGVIRNKKNQVVGLLLHYTEADCTLQQAISRHSPGKESKKLWEEQIKETIGALHNKGIVWGDAKPDNILIDEDGDAWLIDFGGGRTEGWVDDDLEETFEGDELAIEPYPKVHLFRSRLVINV